MSLDATLAPRLAEILMVEDNPGDVRLTREAFAYAGISGRLNVVHDGVEALAYLRRETPFLEAARPDLILLDLNLPRKDGREVLAEIKADPLLKRIPVVVLTSSQAEEDVLRAYSLCANCYIPKPVLFDQFLRTIQSIHHFWLTTVTLPGA